MASLRLDESAVWKDGTIVAHRGSRIHRPENTMVAFGNGLDEGAHHLETDLRLTSDGVVVCFHDPTLDRTTDGEGPFTGRTLAELRRLDAGHRHRIDGGFPVRGRGLRIPTLGEVLATFPATGVVVDLKEDGLEEPVAALLDRMEAWDRVIVGSFSDERLARMARVSGGRAMLSGGQTTVLGWWVASRLGRPGPGSPVALQVPPSHHGLRVVDERFVRTAHAAGVAVHVWTVNQPWEMERLVDMGVDALITDRPGRAAALTDAPALR